MDGTKIEWADATWNPVIGCEQVSPGCANCYAKTLVETRFGKDFGVPDFKPHKNFDPLRWQRPRVIFPNSLSDLFWEAITDDWLDLWFAVMALAHWHTFMLLTKRHDRMLEYLTNTDTPKRIARQQRLILGGPEFQRRKNMGSNLEAVFTDTGNWPIKNLKLGVSAENDHWWHIRLTALRACPAAFRWVSAEPLLSSILVQAADLVGINLVIGGGESGSRARATWKTWAENLRDDVLACGVAFDWKQWGEWAPVTLYGMGEKPGWQYVQDDNLVVHYLPDSKVSTGAERTARGTRHMARIGKKAAGRLLDGKLHDYRKGQQQHVEE